MSRESSTAFVNPISADPTVNRTKDLVLKSLVCTLRDARTFSMKPFSILFPKTSTPLSTAFATRTFTEEDAKTKWTCVRTRLVREMVCAKSIRSMRPFIASALASILSRETNVRQKRPKLFKEKEFVPFYSFYFLLFNRIWLISTF